MTYDPNDRIKPCPEDSQKLRSIEVKFSIPVRVTQEQQQRLMKVVEDIVNKPWNIPKEGLHWVSSVGSKAVLSRIDALLLGEEPERDAHHSGEPEFNSEVLCIESTARPFSDSKERERELFNRSSPGLCSECREPQFMTPGGPTCSNAHGGAPTLSRDTGEELPTVAWALPSAEAWDAPGKIWDEFDEYFLEKDHD